MRMSKVSRPTAFIAAESVLRKWFSNRSVKKTNQDDYLLWANLRRTEGFYDMTKKLLRNKSSSILLQLALVCIKFSEPSSWSII